MPEVCVSSCRIVMGCQASGTGASQRDSGSSIDSLPSAASSWMAAAANCLPTEPDWKTVSGRTGTRCSTFASP